MTQSTIILYTCMHQNSSKLVFIYLLSRHGQAKICRGRSRL